MNISVSVHECLFCSQTFDSAAIKDDHVMQHFAQETCIECEQDLIRIGNRLFIPHDTITCIKRLSTSEKHCESSTIQIDVNSPDPVEECLPCQSEVPSTDCKSRDLYAKLISKYQLVPCTVNVEKLQIKAEPMDQNDEYIPPTDDTQSSLPGQSQPMQESVGSNEFDEREVSTKVSCDICGKVVHRLSLPRHTIVKHSSPDAIFCNICATIFSTVEERDAHRVECNQRKRKRDTKSRRRSRARNTNQFQCDICEENFSSKLLLRKHTISQHSDVTQYESNSSNITDDQSNDVSPWFFGFDESQLQPNELRDEPSLLELQTPNIVYVEELQIKAEPMEQIVEYILDMDDTQSSVPNQSQPMRKSADSSEVVKKKVSTIVACDICGKVLHRCSLNRHTILKHSPPDTIFCRICAKICSTAEELETHKQIRCNPIFKCDICGIKFAGLYSLRKHTVSLHSNLTQSEMNGSNEAHSEEIPSGSSESRKETEPLTSQQDESAELNRLNEPLSDSSENKSRTKVPCDVCGIELSDRKSLRQHKLFKHRPPKTIICGCCTKLFTNVEDRDIHRIECAKKKYQRKVSRRKELPRVPCDICGKLLNRDRVRTHKLMVHRVIGGYKPNNFNQTTDPLANQLENKISCDVCGVEYEKMVSLRVHKFRKHRSPKTISCDICFKSFSTVEDRNTHRIECARKRSAKRIMHNVPAKTSESNSLNITEDQSDNAIICLNELQIKTETTHCIEELHIKPEPTEQNVEYILPTDVLSLPNESQPITSSPGPSKAAKKIVHGRAPCNVCGVVLSKISHNSHMILKHSPPGTNYCKTCVKVCATAEELETHRMKYHQCHCDYCGVDLVNKYSLRNHMISLHSDVKHNSPDKPPENRLKNKKTCDICGRKYVRSLRDHKIRAHSPKGTILCSICTATFSTVEERTIHRMECARKKNARHKIYLKSLLRVQCDISGKEVRQDGLKLHKLFRHNLRNQYESNSLNISDDQSNDFPLGLNEVQNEVNIESSRS